MNDQLPQGASPNCRTATGREARFQQRSRFPGRPHEHRTATRLESGTGRCSLYASADCVRLADALTRHAMQKREQAPHPYPQKLVLDKSSKLTISTNFARIHGRGPMVRANRVQFWAVASSQTPAASLSTCLVAIFAGKDESKLAALQTLRELNGAPASAERLDCVRLAGALAHRAVERRGRSLAGRKCV